MPPPLLFDLSGIDLSAEPIYGRPDIDPLNPQRYEMEQLDGILWVDTQARLILGYKDVTQDQFWVRGHIPGRPLMPAVIMIEAAAQLSSFFVKRFFGIEAFIGFAGIESAKFRSPVQPGARLLLLGHLTKFGGRKYTMDVQGVVDGTLAFEATVSGMRV